MTILRRFSVAVKDADGEEGERRHGIAVDGGAERGASHGCARAAGPAAAVEAVEHAGQPLALTSWVLL